MRTYLKVRCLVLIFNALLMSVIGDVLSGTWSEGEHHLGVMQEWFGHRWWTERSILLLLTTLLVFSPLISFNRVGEFSLEFKVRFLLCKCLLKLMWHLQCLYFIYVTAKIISTIMFHLGNWMQSKHGCTSIGVAHHWLDSCISSHVEIFCIFYLWTLGQTTYLW